MLNDLLIWDLEWWSPASVFMDAFAQRFSYSKPFTHWMVTSVKKRMNNTKNKWRLTADEDAHHIGTRRERRVPPSFMELFSNSNFAVPTDRKPERPHTRDYKHKTQREIQTFWSPFSTSFSLATVHTYNLVSFADRKHWHKNKHWELAETTRYSLPVNLTYKHSVVQPFEYRTFRFNEGLPS